MNPEHRADTARDLEAELTWFAALIDWRFKQHFDLAPGAAALAAPPPDLGEATSAYARLVRDLAPARDERAALLLALTPHLRPRLLDLFHTRNASFDRRFTEFGGVRTSPDGDFQPTGETLAFLLGGDCLETRLRVIALLDPAAALAKRNLLRVAATGGEDLLKAPILLHPDALATVLLGHATGPPFSATFPARRLETGLEWSDLVLHPATRAQVAEIEQWITHGPTLMGEWGMARTLRPGYRALFHGPPGTGKTMTATLIGKATGRPVYRVDLALIVSKYIGETEKNLANVFDGAEARGWILFFDEADALFGKRSETRDAHDRYANQEVAFLLQRIETFDGIVILASNLRENIDPAFARRFESLVHFPMPRAEERARLWRQALPAKAVLAPDADLEALARDHPLTGGAIINAVRFAALTSLAEDRPIAQSLLLQAVRREQAKEGRS